MNENEISEMIELAMQTQVTNEITVAETVIVGEVPGTYTYFATDPDAYAGDAKDYILNKD